MIVFRIKERYDGHWVPDHEEVSNQAEFIPDPEAPKTFEQIRQELFNSIEESHPGEYTLEYPLAEAKAIKLEAINARTDLLLKEGFLYNGARYGTSAVDQAYYNMLRLQQYGIISGLTLSYPVQIASVDAQAIFSASNSTSLALFLSTQAAFLRQTRDGDVALKAQVKSATTSATVLAIQDNR